MAEVQPHVVRMVKEHMELAFKINALRAFISSGGQTYTILCDAEKSDMDQQLNSMKNYADNLQRRICRALGIRAAVHSATKKPIAIDYVYYTGELVSANLVVDFTEGAAEIIMDEDDSFAGMIITTLEGTMNVTAGDFIIKGVQGEFYPCKPDIFLETYELNKG